MKIIMNTPAQDVHIIPTKLMFLSKYLVNQGYPEFPQKVIEPVQPTYTS